MRLLDVDLRCDAQRDQGVFLASPQEKLAVRILVVNWLDPCAPRAGGAELHLLEVFSRLVNRGHSVTVVTSGWSSAAAEEWIRGLRIVRIGGFWTFPLVWRRAVRGLGGEAAFDVLVEDLNKIPLGVGRVAPRRTVLLVHHLWGWAAFHAARWPVALVTWLAERGLERRYRGQRAVVVSESGRRDLVERGFQPDTVRVVYNGVVVSTRGPAGEGEREATPLFVFVGRLQRYKRVHLLVQALGELQQEGCRCRLVIAGHGPAERALKDYVAKLGLTALVQFAGFVSDREREDLFRSSWAHVQPSSREGWGLTVMEAAAQGTCAVTANSAGLNEAVEHGRTGLLVPHRHLPTFADALRFLCRNPKEAWRMGEAAYHRATEFTWDRAASGVEEVLSAAAV
jgi:glycosyltransferase involved in cell wall biosynthesis